MTPTCPGPQCVYRQSTTESHTNGTLGVLGEDYFENYTDFEHYDSFLGYILNENGLIIEQYACGTNNNIVYCLRGAEESSLENKLVYSDNIERLKVAFPNCDTSSSNEYGTIYCSGERSGNDSDVWLYWDGVDVSGDYMGQCSAGGTWSSCG